VEFTDNRDDGFWLCCVGLGVFVFFYICICGFILLNLIIIQLQLFKIV